MSKFVQRSMLDNVNFCKYMDEAVDKSVQAISSITYESYPELNKVTIDKIKEAIKLLNSASDDIFDLKKPAK